VADGQTGPRTLAAIKRFQTDRYLPVTGQLDEATLGRWALAMSSQWLRRISRLGRASQCAVSFSDGEAAGPGRPLIAGCCRAQTFWDRERGGLTCIDPSQPVHNPKLIYVACHVGPPRVA
jgi:peptidoglycan hydrolase-like protein with peptidoglycan-binding domain